MSHSLLSPSSAERWLNCTPAPRLEADFPDSTSEYAAEGTLAHSVSELFARKKFSFMKPSAYNSALKKLKADPLWKDEMTDTANTYVEHLMERFMAFDAHPYIAFEVKVDISDYVPEARGTCDCVMVGGNELIITDYKHGVGVSVSPIENPQMMLYALGALKVYRAVYGESIKKVSMYIDQPRLDSYDGYSLSVEELETWGEQVVKPKAQLAFAGLGNFNPGDHCKFCRAKAQCRARADVHTALEDFKDALLPTPENRLRSEAFEGAKPLLSDAEIGKLLNRGKSLLDWYESLKEYALKTCLEGGVIPGWKAVEGRSIRQWSDQDKALETLISGGLDEAVLFERVPKSLAQIEKLLGKTEFEKMEEFVIKPPGKPSLAPESDKRPQYSSAAADFKGVGADADS